MAGDLERLNNFVGQLLDGWSERIEYAVPYQRHTQACNDSMVALSIHQLRHHVCDCPVNMEQRAERRWQPPLVTQLVEAGYLVPTTGDTSGGSGATNKPGSKAPGNLLRPDELLCRLADVVADHLRMSVTPTRLQLPVWLKHLPEHLAENGSEEDVRAALADVRTVVYQARVFLGYDSQSVMFESSVCGECGGALKVSRDVDTRTEVRCAGTPSEAPCGKRYPWNTWIDLLGASAT